MLRGREKPTQLSTLLCLPFLGVEFGAPDASILPANVPSRAAYNVLAQRFNEQETTPILLAVQTHGNVLTTANIRNLYYYVKRIEADPRVARVDSIVSADPRFTLDQYELLFEEKLQLWVELLKQQPVTWSGQTRAALTSQKVYPPTESGTLKTWVAVGGSGEGFVSGDGRVVGQHLPEHSARCPLRMMAAALFVERLGHDVHVVLGSERNIKITRPSDMDLARFYLSEERRAK